MSMDAMWGEPYDRMNQNDVDAAERFMQVKISLCFDSQFIHGVMLAT